MSKSVRPKGQRKGAMVSKAKGFLNRLDDLLKMSDLLKKKGGSQ